MKYETVGSLSCQQRSIITDNILCQDSPIVEYLVASVLLENPNEQFVENVGEYAKKCSPAFGKKSAIEYAYIQCLLDNSTQPIRLELYKHVEAQLSDIDGRIRRQYATVLKKLAKYMSLMIQLDGEDIDMFNQQATKVVELLADIEIRHPSSTKIVDAMFCQDRR